MNKKGSEPEFDLENFAYNQNEKPMKERKPKKKVEEKNRDKEKANHFLNQFKNENSNKAAVKRESIGSEEYSINFSRNNQLNLIEEEDDFPEEE